MLVCALNAKSAASSREDGQKLRRQITLELAKLATNWIMNLARVNCQGICKVWICTRERISWPKVVVAVVCPSPTEGKQLPALTPKSCLGFPNELANRTAQGPRPCLNCFPSQISHKSDVLLDTLGKHINKASRERS